MYDSNQLNKTQPWAGRPGVLGKKEENGDRRDEMEIAGAGT